MTTPPEGATRSEDGHYWWDSDSNQWQPVPGGAADSSSAAAASPDHSGGAADGPGQAVAETVNVEGACFEQDLEDADIDGVLAAAGVSLETS